MNGPIITFTNDHFKVKSNDSMYILLYFYRFLTVFIFRFDSLNDQLKDRVELMYEYDPSLSPKCNSIFQIFEESPFLKTIWRIYKPFVR